MSQSDIQEVQPGDVLLMEPSAEGVLRGSQIGPSMLHFFYFRPESLVGLLSLSERLSLERFGQSPRKRIIPATEAAAKEYAEIVRTLSRRRSFFYRCQLLHLVAMIFGETLPEVPSSKHHVTTTAERFEDLISRIPDVDLMNYSSAKLAEMSGCSLRHFRRMFRKQFKTSIRVKQAELRLEKARHLLAETEERILTIAAESGYRHVGFFSASFKKHFGVTPTEWRQVSRQPAGGKTKSTHVS